MTKEQADKIISQLYVIILALGFIAAAVAR